MSARTELLLEQIRDAENELSRAACNPVEHDRLSVKLQELRKQLSTASEALTEGKQVLKG